MNSGAPTSCRICSAPGPHPAFTVREMMFGSREEFKYFQCAACGCLQIASVPADLARHYPSNYYSHLDPAPPRPRSLMERFLRSARDRYAWTGNGLLGSIVYHRNPYPLLKNFSLVPGFSRQSRVLDVGCGSGFLLESLRENGFDHLLGVDEFLPHDQETSNGVPLLKRRLDQVDGRRDLIMFHHSFEHMPEPTATMRQASSALAPGGCCLVRIPVADSWAWRHYGVDWVQLDAPRHLFLHTRESLRILAAGAGLKILKIAWDSTAFQFWGSEQYRQDIPLRDARSYSVNPAQSPFTPEAIRNYAKRAEALNRDGQGDMAAFYLVKA